MFGSGFASGDLRKRDILGRQDFAVAAVFRYSPPPKRKTRDSSWTTCVAVDIYQLISDSKYELSQELRHSKANLIFFLSISDETFNNSFPFVYNDKLNVQCFDDRNH